MLDSKLFNSVIVTVIQLTKDTPDLFLYRALHFPTMTAILMSMYPMATHFPGP